MAGTPQVSVLIPTFNSAHLLQEAIESVLNQTFLDFELIVVDNHSTDNTEDVVRKYLNDPRVLYFRNESNIGLAGNWNKCLTYARGKYVKYLCSDDKFHPRMLEEFVPIMEQHPNVSVISCYKEEFGAKSILWKTPFSQEQSGKKVILETIKHHNFLGEPSCVMFRKEDELKVGGFRNFDWITDWEMWVRLLTIGDCYIVPERLCFTRNHPAQLTKKIYTLYINFWEEYILFKALKNKEYNIDFSAEADILNEAIVNKAACYATILPKAVFFASNTHYRIAIRKALHIVYSEKAIKKTLQLMYKKMVSKLLFSKKWNNSLNPA